MPRLPESFFVSNNGMNTKKWGRCTWQALHSITFGYPLRPTKKQKECYLQFFRNVGFVLPCAKCRESYRKFTSEGITRLNAAKMENRESLVRWLYDVHNRVNAKLKKPSITLGEVIRRYEKCRAKDAKNQKSSSLLKSR